MRLMQDKWRQYGWGYVFIFPNLMLLFVFYLYPLLNTFRISLFDYGLGGAHFIGLDNFTHLIQNTVFLRSLRNTILFAALIVPVVVIVSLILAGLMQGLNQKAKSWYRMLFYLPDICTAVVLTMVWEWMFNMNFGLMNYLVGLVGLGPFQWLGSPSIAILSICFAVISWSLGRPIILYLASIDGIPKELYEAAEIDGASPLRKFFGITVPMIGNTSLFIVITSTIAVFQLFVVIQILTGGGPFRSTETLVFTIYRTAFVSVEFGLAAAQSVVLFVVILAIALLQLKWFKPKTD